KLLQPGLQGNAAFLRRFRAEARAAAALSHPNIVAVYDWDEGAEPYLVLEYLPGGSLLDLLDAGRRLDAAQAAAMGAEVARALAYAHRRGVVHRDVKPANLLFDEEGRSRVADFGLARAFAEAAWTEPVGGLVGTARYASPEQAEGLEVDGKADVYSLALVLVEAMTGSVPFAASTTLSTLMARVGNDLSPPEDVGPLAEVLAEAGRARPAERLDSGEVAARLEKLAVSLPVPAPLPLVSHEASSGGGPGPDPTLVESATFFAPADLGSSGRAPFTSLGGAAATRGAPAGVGRGAPPARAGGRRRRWPFVAAALLALMAAGGVAFGVHELTRPTYRLPALHGDSVVRAKQLLGGHLRVVVASHQYDDGVPAGQIDAQSPLAGTMMRDGSTVAVVLSRGPAPRAVPNLTNDNEVAAVQALTRSGFRYQAKMQYSETVSAGQVITWSPTGVQPYGTMITLQISQGPTPRTVPNLGPSQTFAQASQALQALGLSAQRQDVYNPGVPKNHVVQTIPGAGASVPRGSTVTVQVSQGPQLVTVPNVASETVAEATSVLQQEGLSVSGVSGPANGVVKSTNPAAGAQVPANSSVKLTTQAQGSQSPPTTRPGNKQN
ncbi:MAG: PASTA domain-containing protein, partial [Acidimicrobiales bacterium]|nr:PASTA domain-containing protein [Acidimicrobiales bacterium]